MSSDVYVKVKMRAVGGRRFVREFKKEYGDRIEDARGVNTGSVVCADMCKNGIDAYCVLSRLPSLLENV